MHFVLIVYSTQRKVLTSDIRIVSKSSDIATTGGDVEGGHILKHISMHVDSKQIHV